MIDLTKIEYKRIEPNITKEELIDLVEMGEEIYGFVGGVILSDPNTELVDSTFPNYLKNKTELYRGMTGETNEAGINVETPHIKTINSLDENGDPILIPKTFAEYVGQCVYPTSLGGYIIPLGQRNIHGNRFTHVSTDEFQIGVNYFGVENILTKSEFHQAILIGRTETETE